MELSLWAGLLGVGALLALLVAGRRRARDASVPRHAEARRRRECGVVIGEFLARYGHAAAEVASREELRALIDEGIEADRLRSLLASRVGRLGGTLLGHTVSGGERLPVRVNVRQRLKHTLVVGRTGSGKSTLLLNHALSDLADGLGPAVLVPEAEFVDELLERIPPERRDDVIVVDPADPAVPVMNPLELRVGVDPDLKADQATSILLRAIGEDVAATAPRTETILRFGVSALTLLPGTTLADLPRLLDRSDDGFRRWAVGRLEDEQTRTFWADTYPQLPRNAHLPLLARFERLLKPRAVRRLLCGERRSLDVRLAMDAGKAILFRPSDGLLGDAAAQAIGQFVLAELQVSAMSRADLPPAERRPFTVIADEWQTFAAGAVDSYERMFSRCRKYGLGLTVANQNLAQIPPPLLKSVLGNIGTAMIFEVGADDARRLSREFVVVADGVPAPLPPEEFLRLRTGEVLCRIGRSVVKLATPPPAAPGDPPVREAVIERSRARYGSASQARAKSRQDGDDRRGLAGLDPRELF